MITFGNEQIRQGCMSFVYNRYSRSHILHSQIGDLEFKKTTVAHSWKLEFDLTIPYFATVFHDKRPYVR